jgi:hypothetical protein
MCVAASLYHKQTIKQTKNKTKPTNQPTNKQTKRMCVHQFDLIDRTLL